MEEQTRKLVTRKKIDSLSPIIDADRIEVAHIGGWNVIVGKGEFQEGEEIFYFETDSMLPMDCPVFEFLRPRGVKVVDGKEYHRLKAMKMRGVVSDGLILPLTILEHFVPDEEERNKIEQSVFAKCLGDYSELFGVIKYEDPVLAKLAGKMSAFPNFIVKTDEERVQNLSNLVKHIAEQDENDQWYATEKIDGTSCTIYATVLSDGSIKSGACSRNYEIEEDEENVYWQIARSEFIKEGDNEPESPLNFLNRLAQANVSTKLKDPTKNVSFVLQGEIFGEGIQSNSLGVKGHHIRFFNFILNGRRSLLRDTQRVFPHIYEHWVPVFEDLVLPKTMEEIIAQPEGITTRVPEATKQTQIEGLVWRNYTAQEIKVTKRKNLDEIDFSKIPEDKWELVKKSVEQPVLASFKALSDKYRLKHQ